MSFFYVKELRLDNCLPSGPKYINLVTTVAAEFFCSFIQEKVCHGAQTEGEMILDVRSSKKCLF